MENRGLGCGSFFWMQALDRLSNRLELLPVSMDHPCCQVRVRRMLVFINPVIRILRDQAFAEGRMVVDGRSDQTQRLVRTEQNPSDTEGRKSCRYYFR